jgi:hypothetical protein
MTATEKAIYFISQFPDLGWELGKYEYEHLTIDFSKRGDWLSIEEESLLRKLNARNIAAYTGGWDGEPFVYTDNLNTSCCGIGSFKFKDDIFGGHITDDLLNSNQGNDQLESNKPTCNA